MCPPISDFVTALTIAGLESVCQKMGNTCTYEFWILKFLLAQIIGNPNYRADYVYLHIVFFIHSFEMVLFGTAQESLELQLFA